jgi:hypothetical protein
VVVRHSPCEYYLKYLVVHPNGYSNEDIKNLSQAQQLDYMGAPHLECLRKECKPPAPFYPGKKGHIASTRFLVKEKLEAIFRPDNDMLLAMKMLGNPHAKELIESSTLAGASSEWTHALLRRQKINSSVMAVEYYRFYYFNMNLIDPEERKAFVMNRAAAIPPSNDPVEQSLNDCYRRAMWDSERMQAARTSVTPYSGLLALMRRGIMPTNAQLNRIFTASRITAAVRADEALQAGRPAELRDYVYAAKMFGEILQDVGEVGEDLQEGLAKLILKTENRELPSIHDLSGGHHTLSLEPVIETEGESVDGSGKDGSSK